MPIAGNDILAGCGYRYLNIAQYDGGSELEREILAPAVPAIYVWVHDFIRLLGLRPDLIEEALRKFSRQQGRQWPLAGDHFIQGELRAKRPELLPLRREVIVRELSEETAIGRSMATLATLQQRPLYCGISINFGRRISQHLQQKTTFAESLAAISLSECAVLWMEIDDSTVRSKSATLANLDHSADEGDPLDTDDEHMAKQVPTLNAFESLMIRVAMPMFNKALDS